MAEEPVVEITGTISPTKAVFILTITTIGVALIVDIMIEPTPWSAIDLIQLIVGILVALSGLVVPLIMAGSGEKRELDSTDERPIRWRSSNFRTSPMTLRQERPPRTAFMGFVSGKLS